MKFLNIKLNVKNNIIFYFTILISIVWYLIFGLNLQPTEVWIQSPTLNLLDSIKKNGISLTDISN